SFSYGPPATCVLHSFPTRRSSDLLWVFANRILANRIFAHRVLADWRRRHRGRLLARQIGGSGNAQHGDEPSRYDYDDLHDANPLDRKSTRLNSSHDQISYAVFCLK